MAKFWLVTFELASSATNEPITTAERRATGTADGWAIDIIHDEELDEYAVLLSEVDDMRAPKKLRCRIGFANGAKTCSIWRERGFPLSDAIIDTTDDRTGLRVRSPCFLEPNAINYDADVISIPGIMIARSGLPVTALEPLYEQAQQAPDYAFPATWIRQRKVAWSPKRSNAQAIAPTTFPLKVASLRMPSLAPFKSGYIMPQAIWHGTVELPKWPPTFSATPMERVSRIDEIGKAAFRFENVEVLGFRLNLDELGVRDDNLLAKLTDRLNFHLDPLDPEELRESFVVRDAVPDFRYCPATRTLMLELLRYGKMKAKGATPPLREDDFQSQHELLVRMLVGRVDADTAQARNPATYVPTIFVDNSWSKVLGRSMQGFDKWMADFCVSVDGQLKPLRPDGRRTEDCAESDELASIREVHLVTNTGTGPSKRVLLQLECPYLTCDNWDAFVPVNMDLALGLSALGPARWRQDDFVDAEFRRSFARSAIPETLKGFHSIQVSPVGEKGLLEKWKSETTLIKGTFSVDDDVQLVMPNGIATLTLHSEPTAPQSWRDLCTLLGIAQGGHGSISLTTGNWYRMRCSMELTVQNSFE